MTVFVAGVLPGEIVDVRLDEPKKGRVEGYLDTVIKGHPERIEAPCPVFGRCGGCDWQFMPYHLQIYWKRQILVENLRRIGKIAILPATVRAVEGTPFRYRNRVRPRVQAETAGFRARKSHSFVPIDACPVATDGINATLSDSSSPLFANTGDSPQEITVFDAGSTLYYSDRDANASLEILGQRFDFDPRGFSQSNVALLPALADHLAEAVSARTVVDLYAGAGLLSFLSIAAAPERSTISWVYAVEPDQRNLRFLRGNITGVDRSVHVDTRRATAEKALPSVKWRAKAAVILDPPRGGLSGTIRRWIIQMSGRVSEVIYLSCDSAALARDLGVLMERYEIVDAVLFDFFPQTAHIETLVILRPRRIEG